MTVKAWKSCEKSTMNYEEIIFESWYFFEMIVEINFFFSLHVLHYVPCSRSTMRKIKHLPRVQPPAKFVHEFGPLVSPTFRVDEDYQGLQEWGGNGLDNKWTILFLGFFPFYRGPPLFSQRWFERPLKKSIRFHNLSHLIKKNLNIWFMYILRAFRHFLKISDLLLKWILQYNLFIDNL